MEGGGRSNVAGGPDVVKDRLPSHLTAFDAAAPELLAKIVTYFRKFVETDLAVPSSKSDVVRGMIVDQRQQCPVSVVNRGAVGHEPQFRVGGGGQ